MSTLNEDRGNGNPTATRLKPEDTRGQIDGILQHFDVLPTKSNPFMVRYFYIYLIGLFILGELLILLSIISQPQAGKFLFGLGVGALPMIVIISGIWLFNVWRLRTPKTLRDLFEKKRIYIPDGDVSTSYLRFLENYRDALTSPMRYFLVV
jgi:hypothetical protein